jgi:hypothetical protein
LVGSVSFRAPRSAYPYMLQLDAKMKALAPRSGNISAPVRL